MKLSIDNGCLRAKYDDKTSVLLIKEAGFDAFAIFADKNGKNIAPLFGSNKNKVATSLPDTYTKVILPRSSSE